MIDGPSNEDERAEQLETKTITLTTAETLSECLLLYQSDNWSKILRLTCYWLRVRKRLQRSTVLKTHIPPDTEEMDEAMWARVL